MITAIYLSRECCDKLGVLYETPYQEDMPLFIVDPLKLLMLRDWDESHLSVFRTFGFLKKSLHLIPEWVDNKYHNGWFTIVNPPSTRFFVTADVDVELLLKQRNQLVRLTENMKGEELRLINGTITLFENMLENAYLDDKTTHIEDKKGPH